MELIRLFYKNLQTSYTRDEIDYLIRLFQQAQQNNYKFSENDHLLITGLLYLWYGVPMERYHLHECSQMLEPIEDIPRYINDERIVVKTVARWRLSIGH